MGGSVRARRISGIAGALERRLERDRASRRHLSRASPGTPPRRVGPSRPTSRPRACPPRPSRSPQIDYQALSDADLVIVGSWVDGLILVGQRPGRLGRITAMPALAGQAGHRVPHLRHRRRAARSRRCRPRSRPAAPRCSVARLSAGTSSAPGVSRLRRSHPRRPRRRVRRRGSRQIQGPTPPMRSTVIRTTEPGGGSSIGGKRTSGPM